MDNRMTKEQFMSRYRKDLERKNRKRQRDVDGATAFLIRSTSGKSNTISNCTKRYSYYGGL